MGCGGHAKEILKRILPGGFLIGLDIDKEAIKISEENLKEFNSSFTLINENFKNISKVVKRLNLNTRVDGILFDLGFSSFHINSRERGFSFNLEGPLDMRFSKDLNITAFDVVNKFRKEEIEKIIRIFGEERFSRRIAESIEFERQKYRISTTLQLAEIIKKAVPFYRKIHPATRTFQAIRIFVNSELENLREGLKEAITVLNPDGRICVISFHSLEDRIVKHSYNHFSKKGIIRILTKKPIKPTHDEIMQNPSSRSAKLRVAQRLSEKKDL